MFTIEMLPGGRGDALWIEYGKANAPRRVMIDGGILNTRKTLKERIEAIPKAKRHFDLLVVTHIDLDHIAGVLGLIKDPPEGLTFDNVLFNGYKQLMKASELPDEDGTLGAKLGEQVTYLIDKRKYTQNKGFKDKLVAIRSMKGALPSITLEGGMTLTLLSPTISRLKTLKPKWEKEIKAAHLKPGEAGVDLVGHPDEAEDDGVLGTTKINIDKLSKTKFSDDTSAANGSSIAVLAEYDGKRAAFLGDAYSSDVAKSFERIAKSDGTDLLELDGIKLSHHGGHKNTGSPMLEKVHCKNYLVSTDGTIYHHPHGESLARVCVAGSKAGKPTIYFNYLSDYTKPWGNKTLYNGSHPYTPELPAKTKPGAKISL